MHEIEYKLSESQFAYNRVMVERKKYEADYSEICDTLNDLKDELKVAEDRVCIIVNNNFNFKKDFKNFKFLKSRNSNAALLKKDEEIRHEREATLETESIRKALEQQLKELQLKVDEGEENARKEARRISAKYEARVNTHL
jgi:hypothetical protein